MFRKKWIEQSSKNGTESSIERAKDYLCKIDTIMSEDVKEKLSNTMSKATNMIKKGVEHEIYKTNNNDRELHNNYSSTY